MKIMKKVLTYLVIITAAIINGISYELFVFPNNFAPSGLNGICTMIQYVSGISVGYLGLIINIPLAVLVYFKVSKSLAKRAMVYVATFSGCLLVMENIDFSAIAYNTPSSAILGPLVAGVITGYIYSTLVRTSAHTGGMDFVASLIHKYRPDINFFSTIFALNATVAAVSFFVYDYKVEPVILCILYSFTSSTVSDRRSKSGRSAIRFEIVTKHPEELARIIIEKIHHSATLIPATGMYKGEPTNVLICVVNKSQAARLASIIRSYPRTFCIMSSVSEVVGNFKQLNNAGQQEVQLLDEGDAQPV